MHSIHRVRLVVLRYGSYWSSTARIEGGIWKATVSSTKGLGMRISQNHFGLQS